MERKTLAAMVAIALALSANLFAQDKMMSATGQGGVDAMMSAPASGGADSMMSGRKVLFSTLNEAQALAAKGPTVLMFSADWCPICRADLKDMDAQGARLGDITVVVVDYDKETDLKTRYGVTYQHTYVQIDAKGRKLGVWSGGGVDGILSHVDRM